MNDVNGNICKNVCYGADCTSNALSHKAKVNGGAGRASIGAMVMSMFLIKFVMTMVSAVVIIFRKCPVFGYLCVLRVN